MFRARARGIFITQVATGPVRPSLRSVRFVSCLASVLLGAVVCLAVVGVRDASATPPTTALGYAYDADGQLKDVSDPAGNTAVFNWDSVGDLLSISRAATSALAVVQLTPARGAVGDTVTIAGTGFSTTPASNTVKFNGTTATVTAATARLLTVKVPMGATTGTVSVTAPSGGPISSSQTFTVGGSTGPKITSISASVATAGTALTISGSNFVTNTIGEVVRVNQSVGEVTSTSASSIHVNVPGATGSGPVSVATAQGTATGPDLFIPVPPALASSVGPTARLTLGTVKTMTFSTAGKTGLAVFDGQRGQKVSVGLTQASFASGWATVYAPDGTTVVGQSYFDSTSGGIVDPVPLPSTGTYTVVVDPGGSTGSVKVTAYDVHDATGTLAPSSGGDTKVLTLGTPGQTGRYSVNATAGESVSVNFTGSTIDNYTMQWLNPDGSLLASSLSTGDTFYDATVLPTAGTYTLVVDPLGFRLGSMTLTAYDSTETTGTLSPSSSGDAKVLSLGVPGKNARLTFSGTAGQEVTFGMTSSSIDTGWATIFAPDGSWVGQGVFTTNGGLIEPVVLPSTGTYTVLVDPVGTDTGNVTLTGYDVHDVTGTLAPSSTGDTNTLTLGTPGQTGRYSVTATAGERVSINVAGSTIDQFGMEWLNPDGSILTSNSGYGGDGFVDPVVLPSAGTYTLVIDPAELRTGSMTLTAYDPVDVTGSITPSATGDSTNVTIGTPGQNAMISFDGVTGQSFSLDVTNSSLAGAWVAVFEPAPDDTATVLQAYFDTSGVSPLPVTLPETGTYTILIDPVGANTGAFTLTGYLDGGMFAMRAGGAATATKPAGGLLHPTFSAPATTSTSESTSAALQQALRARLAPRPHYGSLRSYLRGPRSHPRPHTQKRLVAKAVPVPASVRRVPGSGSVLWRPSAANRRGLDWLTGRRATPWTSVPLARAIEGETGLAGRALTLDGLPLAGVKVSIEKSTATARTGRDGSFLLSGTPSGHHVLIVDGTTASHGTRQFGTFEIGVELAKGRTTNLDYTLWMTALDPAGNHRVASPTKKDLVLTTPRIPGLEVHLPAGTVIHDAEKKIVRRLNITQVPVDRPPFPLPPGVQVPLYFTIQPGRAYLSKGAQIIYPNYTHLQAGQRVNFWNYDADKRGWFVYGHGTVTPDAKQVVPDPDVKIWEFTGAMISTDPAPPASGPTVGGGASSGDPVDLQTGLFTYHKTDLVLPDTIPVVVDHTYRQSDTNSYSFGLGATSVYDMRLWSNNNYQTADLVMPNGGRVHYVRTSPGGGFNDAVYQTSTTPGPFFGSTIFWDGPRLGFDLQLRNGLTYAFGEVAPLQAIFDRYGNQVTITRQNGQNGNITQITSPHGRWVRFTYDGSSRITQAHDNGGRTVNYTYDTSGRLATDTDAASRVTTYGYNTSNQLTTVKDGRNNTFVTTAYDTNGRVHTQTAGDSGLYTFAYTLDGSGHVTNTTVTDPRTYQRKVSFNSDGYPITDIEALGDTKQQTTTFERQAGTNQLLSVTDPRGRKTAYQYDTAGDITQVTQLAGTGSARSSTLTYEPTFGLLASFTDPLGHATSFHYGSQGELLSATDPLGHATTYTHDADGQVTSQTTPLGKTTSFGYFSGDLVSITDPLGRRSTQFLDSLGRLASSTTPGGQLTVFDHDADNGLTKVTDPIGNATNYAYDADGNLISVTDARSHATTATYDSMDRLASVTDPLTHATLMVYDKNGNVTQVTDRRGKVSTFTYDALNRRTQAKYGVVGATAESTSTFTYDNGNRLSQLVDSADGTTTPTYDDFDRLTSLAAPLGTISYGYDNADRRTSMTAPGQSAVAYGYDNADRLTSLTRGGQSVTLAYDNDDRRTSTTLVDGISEQYAYDNASQLTGITYKNGATTLGDLNYDYDTNGHLGSTWGSYARTNVPATMASATYNNANERTAQGATTLTYDNNGNLTSDGTSTYTWDARSQLASIAGPTTASFAYDPFGRRTKRTVGATTTKFLSDGPNVVQESVGGTVTANLLNGGADETFARTTSAGTDSFLTDRLGSTIALANSTPSVQTSYTYDPFGAATTTGTANSNPFQYTGRENDATGLDYYRSRYYSPTQERFISQDPAGMSGSGTNPYAYTANDPTDAVDPSGMISIGMWVSNAAAGALNTMTFGISNDIAGVDGHCAGPGYGFGTFAGAPIAIGIGIGLGGGPLAADGGAAIGEGIGAGEGAGAGEGIGVGASADDPALTITQGHGARHLLETSLVPADVEAAIEAQIRQSASGASVGGPFWGRISIGGQTIEYRAYGLDDGTINVGTYYPLP